MLFFGNARLSSIENSEIANRITFEFDLNLDQQFLAGGSVVYQRQGTSSGWNLSVGTRSGCSIADDERHVDLAGNDPSIVPTAFIESAHVLLFESGSGAILPRPVLSSTRTPNNACYLRGVSQTHNFDVVFERLWENNSLHRTSHFAETIELNEVRVESWELRIESGVLEEEIRFYPVVVPSSGTLTPREFDFEGSPTTSTAINF